MINNIATNLVTKGLLNISNITKGMIFPVYEIVFKKRVGGGSGPRVPLHYNRESLYDEIKRHDENDIDLIKVHVDWSGSSLKGYKKMEAKIIEKYIAVEILHETNKKIKVQLI